MDVIEMTRSQHLQPGGLNSETWAVQSGAVLAAATSLTMQEATTVPEGSVVEWDDETMEAALVKDRSGTTLNFQTRGYLDTDPADHADGTRLIVDSVYLKKILYDALRSVIASLRGFGLYAKANATGLTYVTSSPVTLPADAIDTLGEMYVANGTTYNLLLKGTHFRVLQHFSPIKVQFLSGGVLGGALTLPYKRDFIDPEDVTLGVGETVLDVDLDDCLIPASLQMHLPLGVAALVLSGRDIPQTDAEHVRRAMSNEGVPVGTRTNLGRTLWTQFISGPITSERVRLLETSPVAISHERY